MNDGTAPAVALHDVRKEFRNGAVRALDGLELTIGRGEFVAVTGPSGCGKSTMLHLVAALDRPTSGSIEVFGEELRSIRDLPAYRGRRVGLVFQLHQLIPHLTAQRNIEVAMIGTGAGRKERIARARDLLGQVDLADREDRLPTELSGGERQRVAIARALANEPALLLADEPTGNLDEQSVTLVLDLFAGLRALHPELTLVVVTHDEKVAARAGRVIRLRAGRLELQPAAPGVTAS